MGNSGFGNFWAAHTIGGRAWEAMGSHGFGNFWAAHTTGGRAREAMGSHGFGNFWAAHTTGGRAGKQWEAMDLVTFGLGIPLGAGLGSNGKQWEMNT